MFFNQRHRAGSFPLRQPKNPHSSNYKLLKNQLDNQTHALLNERKHLEVRNSLHQTPPTNHMSANHVHQKGPKSRVSQNIGQIVQLCEDDKKQLRNEFEEMSKAEMDIFQLLKEQKTEKLQLDNYEVPEQRSGKRKEKQRERKSGLKSQRERKGEKNEVSESFQNIREKLQKQNGFSDDVLMMIEAIQRKALVQIDALKQDKIQLCKQLNQQRNQRLQLEHKLSQIQQAKGRNYEGWAEDEEIHSIMEENNVQVLKNRILQLYQQIKKYKYLLSRQSGMRHPTDSDHLKEQISNLEHKLYEYQIQIDKLKSSRSNNLQFDRLLEQGELLRRETLHLLRKQGLLDMQVEKIIKNLQEKLEEEEITKNAFLHDLEKFKENYLQLEEQNRRLRQRMREEVSEYQWKSHHTRASRNEPRRRSPKRGKERLGSYEALIGEIKRAST